jgi:nucleoside-diphosphate-sugar epimerase
LEVIMRVLVAGATGVIGRQLLPLLAEVGHTPIVLTRPGVDVATGGLEAVGADVFDRVMVRSAVAGAAPDAVVNLLSAIPQMTEPRHFGKQMAMTNRLRSEATANVVAAAPGARVVSAGVAYAYRPAGGPVACENRPLWVDGPRPFRPVVDALVELERVTVSAGGVVLRFGHLYGPGTAFAADGAFAMQVRARRAPIVGHGEATFSFLHTHDAATAIVAALDRPVVGALNVVDDEPVPVHVWLPALADLLGAPPPRHVHVAVARLLGGSWGVAYMDQIVGADNTRAHFELDWRPRFGSWRSGFAAELAPPRDVGVATG